MSTEKEKAFYAEWEAAQQMAIAQADAAIIESLITRGILKVKEGEQ